MKPIIVVDASVVVKWLVPEEHSQIALDLRDRYVFAAPDLLFAEVTNIIWKKWRRGELTTDEAGEAIFAFNQAQFQIQPAQMITTDALRLAQILDHPAYDCFYLCAAALLETMMVTADERLLRKLSGCNQPEWARLAAHLTAA